MNKKLFIIQSFLLFLGLTPIYTGADNQTSSQKKKSSQKLKKTHSKRNQDTGEFSTTAKTALGCCSAMVIGGVLRSIQSSDVSSETETPTDESVSKEISNESTPSTVSSQNNLLNLEAPVTTSKQKKAKKKKFSTITSVSRRNKDNKPTESLSNWDISSLKDIKTNKSSSSDEYIQDEYIQNEYVQIEHEFESNTNHPSQQTQHLIVPTKTSVFLSPQRYGPEINDYTQALHPQNKQITQKVNITQDSQHTLQTDSDSSNTDTQNNDSNLRHFASNNEVNKNNLEAVKRDQQRLQAKKNAKKRPFIEDTDDQSSSSHGTVKIISPILESPSDSNESDTHVNYMQHAIFAPMTINTQKVPKVPSNHTPPPSSQIETDNDNFSITEDSDEIIQSTLPLSHSAKLPTKIVQIISIPKTSLLSKENATDVNMDITHPVPSFSQVKSVHSDAHSSHFSSQSSASEEEEEKEITLPFQEDLKPSDNNTTTLSNMQPLRKLNAMTPITEDNEMIDISIDISERNNPTSEDSDNEHGDSIFIKTNMKPSVSLAMPSGTINTLHNTENLLDLNDASSSSDSYIIETQKHKKRVAEGIPSPINASVVLPDTFDTNNDAVKESTHDIFDDSSSSKSSSEDDESVHTNQSNSQNHRDSIHEEGNGSPEKNQSPSKSKPIAIPLSPTYVSKQNQTESRISQEYHKKSHSQIKHSSKDDFFISPLHNRHYKKQSTPPLPINEDNNQGSGNFSPCSSSDASDKTDMFTQQDNLTNSSTPPPPPTSTKFKKYASNFSRTPSPRNKNLSEISQSYEILANSTFSPTESFQKVNITASSPSQNEKNSAQVDDPIAPQTTVNEQVSKPSHNDDADDNANNGNIVQSPNKTLDKDSDKINTSLT